MKTYVLQRNPYKKTISLLLILPIILTCVLYSTPPAGLTNFPLQEVASIPVNEDIEEIAVGESWIAVRTDNSLISLDIDTYELLWTLDIIVDKFGEGFQMVGDILVTANSEQVFLIDRQGQQREFKLKPDGANSNILQSWAVYPGYLYVFRGDNWRLEAYDITNNVLLWEIRRGRPSVLYDAKTGIAYVLRADLISAIDHQTGKVLWENRRQEQRILPSSFTLGVLGATLHEKVLYIYERTKDRDYYRITAIDVTAQREVWRKDFTFSITNSVTILTVVDKLLLANGGNGLLALDKSNGELIWETNGTGEGLQTKPFIFNGVIYSMGEASATVFAISTKDGSIIGTANLERDDNFGGESSKNLYPLKDGILLNTRNSIVIYKAK